jgi:malate synthase
LSKLQSAKEAKLWDDIFTWSESKLGLETGSIRACVLIENILAAFEMEAILFELKDHAIGLNCGMFRQTLSFFEKFRIFSNFFFRNFEKFKKNLIIL